MVILGQTNDNESAHFGIQELVKDCSEPKVPLQSHPQSLPDL